MEAVQSPFLRLEIPRQESYSRGELILRAMFGAFYIAIPHAFLLFFLSIWGAILGTIAFWILLFTEKYPKDWFDYQVNLARWGLRLQARFSNLADGYPPFGLGSDDPAVILELEYPERISRGDVLLKAFFGIFYVMIPHLFILFFRQIWAAILSAIAFWVILFTGSYPADWHRFQVDTLRWNLRVNFYMSHLTTQYPPFNGKP
jgi:hypothetical protein